MMKLVQIKKRDNIRVSKIILPLLTTPAIRKIRENEIENKIINKNKNKNQLHSLIMGQSNINILKAKKKKKKKKKNKCGIKKELI